jgi:ABC-2 type transport system ATP-binding protein
LSTTQAIEINSVTKSFGDFKAVTNLSLDVAQGSVFGLLGPNGAGKTTTIRMIVSITFPDSGEVKVFGQHITPKMQERIGYLPEERGLYKKMKVLDQLRFLGGLKSVPQKELDKRINHWAERLQIAGWLDKKTEELSKGMQQKIQFIATVLHNPELIILDEPFSGLDPVNTNLLIEIIHQLKANGTTIILSTHVMEQVEKLCDDICLINKSQKVLAGNLKTIKKGFSSNKIAFNFEGESNFLNNNNLINKTSHYASHLEVELVDGADGQELLKQAINSGVRINRFELMEPSLNEIFIRKVGKNE